MMNRQTLLRILNEEQPFDTDIAPVSEDLLSLHFTCGEHETMTYGFRFEEGGKWSDESYDPLMWMWHHAEELSGKIRNAIDRKKITAQ